MYVNFKNEKEVKEYLENLGIEYRFGCFSEKNPEVCHLLGDYLDAIKRDFPKASKIYKTNCDEYSYPRSCYIYGNYALTGKGHDKKDKELAYSYFTKGCDLGVANSCLKAGLMEVTGSLDVNREKNYEKGLVSLEKSCNFGNEYACYFLSGVYILGSNDQKVEKDMEKAFKYSERACELGNMYACSNLSLMYKKGEGVEKNEEMSEKMRKKAEELKEELDSELSLQFGRSK